MGHSNDEAGRESGGSAAIEHRAVVTKVSGDYPERLLLVDDRLLDLLLAGGHVLGG